MAEFSFFAMFLSTLISDVTILISCFDCRVHVCTSYSIVGEEIVFQITSLVQLLIICQKYK